MNSLDNFSRTLMYVSLVSCVSIYLVISPDSLANPLTDTHVFWLGAFEQDVDLDASATRDPFPKLELDFGKVLGLEESSTTVFLSYQWRFAEKWKLHAFYSQMEADGKKVATRDFNWDGEEYTAGLRLDTEFGLDTLLLAADYSFIRDERKELGVGFGLHAFDIQTTIEIEAAIAGIEDVRDEGVRNKSDLIVPLPNLRAYGRYMITPRWMVAGSLGWLSFNYDDYDGSYLFVTAMTEYRFTDRFGIGFSYQVSEIDVDHKSKHGSEEFEVDQYGPSIYLTYGF